MPEAGEFTTLAEVGAVVDAWRHRYNTSRPHGSLNYQSPSAYAAELAARPKEMEPRETPNTGTGKEAPKAATKAASKTATKSSLKVGAWRGVRKWSGHAARKPHKKGTFSSFECEQNMGKVNPESPRVDNGPEFTGADFREWAGDHGVTLCYGRPGKPTDNAHIESFNGRFREECPKRGEFTTLGEVGAVVDAWRHRYNTSRPHGGLNYQSPSAYAAELAARPKEMEPGETPNTGTGKEASKVATKAASKTTTKGASKTAAKGASKTAAKKKVADWVAACFPASAGMNMSERCHRFVEECLDLAQANGCSKDDVLQLVDYVFDRPVGSKDRELGGVMVALAALSNALNLSMDTAGENELARNWERIEAIRRKQAAKLADSPLPGKI